MKANLGKLRHPADQGVLRREPYEAPSDTGPESNVRVSAGPKSGSSSAATRM